MFLQPDKTDKQKGKFNRVFSEGWVEFASKKVSSSLSDSPTDLKVGEPEKKLNLIFITRWREWQQSG